MTETDSTANDDAKDKKKVRLSRPGKLELKKTVDAGTVKQSFSHGRSKMVAVEVRKKRTFAPGEGGRMAKVDEEVRAPEPEQQPAVAEAPEAPAVEEVRADNLTDGERAARARALEEARIAAVEAEKRAKEEEKEAAARAVREAEEAQQREKEEEAQRLREAEEARLAAEVAAQKAAEDGAKAVKQAPKPKVVVADDDDEGRGGAAKKAKARPEVKAVAPARGKGEPRRRSSGKLTIAAALGDGEERTRSLAAIKRRREKEKQKLHQAHQDGQKIVRDVVIPDTITVQELANRMAERGAAVVRSLMSMGVMATITQTIDGDTAQVVAEEFGHNVKRVSESDVEVGLAGGTDRDEDLVARPPVVTVMGHVDHGKTSLLDALRSTDVVAGEAGGITQHIGAYQITMEGGDRITFIDTPGHAAFTEMRARGARVTDIVVLVVAADDGIMPQTVEAIHHAKAAGVPVIVAINKIDKPEANAQRVRNELLQHEIVLEEVGGDVLAVEVSAKAKINLDKLEEAILLQAEVLDLKANPNRPAEGIIVEAKMERGRGAVATVLVQRGTLKVGNIVVAGSEWGRVRALVDDHGKDVAASGPGTPVEILGLSGVPAAGDEVVVVESEQRAREVSEFRQRKDRDARAAASARGTLEQMFDRIREGEASSLPVVVKADVHGSVEAISQALEKLATDEVKVAVLHAGVGGINESDVTLARASGALIIGFNVRANPQARDLAKRDGVDIRYYSIIYDVTDDVKQMLSGMLAPTLKEHFLGNAEIREVFSVSKVGKVAGCLVTDGIVKRGAKVRLLREDVVIHEGELSQLKRFKDDAKEVKMGLECGMAFANYHDLKVGDIIECFEVEEIARVL